MKLDFRREDASSDFVPGTLISIICTVVCFSFYGLSKQLLHLHDSKPEESLSSSVLVMQIVNMNGIVYCFEREGLILASNRLNLRYIDAEDSSYFFLHFQIDNAETRQ